MFLQPDVLLAAALLAYWNELSAVNGHTRQYGSKTTTVLPYQHRRYSNHLEPYSILLSSGSATKILTVSVSVSVSVVTCR